MSTPSRKHEQNNRRINILDDPEVAGALDRVNKPDRGATYVVGTVAKALGHDINCMTLSRSLIRRSRNRNHEKQATVEQEFMRSTLT